MLNKQGFEIHQNFLSQTQVDTIIQSIDLRNHTLPAHGIRNAEKKFPAIYELVNSELLISKAKQVLAARPKLVRVILFDKTPDKNWLVTWHQDKTISVNKKREIKNWGPWTLKDDVNHVQPSLDVLEKMVAFRIHLDPTDKSNGCLKVIPNSHRFGILSKDKTDQIVSNSEIYQCNANAGDLLIMSPLLLHSSSKGNSPSHRRIIHIEYSSFTLPEGLAWY